MQKIMGDDFASGGQVVQTNMADDQISPCILAPNLNLTSDM